MRVLSQKRCANMTTRLLLLMQLLMHLLVTLTHGEQCRSSQAVPESFETEPPGEWCSIDVKVELQQVCWTSVTEVMTLPWTSQIIARIIPHQSTQSIGEVTARVTRMAQQTTASQTATEVTTQVTTGEYNTTVQIATKAFNESMRITLEYRVQNGITLYESCGNDIVKFPELVAGTHQPLPTVMQTRWAMGGLTITKLHKFSIEFQKMYDALGGIIDITARSKYKQFKKSIRQGGYQVAPASAKAEGETEDEHPSNIVIFLRTYHKNVARACTTLRDCESDSLLIKQGVVPGFPIGIMIVSILFVLLVVGLVVLVVVWQYYRNAEEDDEGQGELDDDAEMPKSLHHFAYDTGDEQSSNIWKTWNEMMPATSDGAREQ